MLVVAQVALALVLLVSSGLMIRTFQALRDVNPGFARPGEVQTLRLSIPDSQVKDEAPWSRMHQAILDKLAAVPGVTSVALASTVTMSGQGWHDPLFAEDRTYAESQIPPIRLFKFVVARLHEDAGRVARRRPRLHVGRTRTSCGRSRWCRRTSRASCGAARPRRSASASGRTPRACGAKWSAWSATCATTA